jgi:hypothetical protein
MKLFVLEEEGGEFDRITGEVTALVITICERLLRRPKLELVHTALFLLHCQAKVVSYHSFDRFMYACAAILVASKLTENIDFYPIHILKALRVLLREKRGLPEPSEEDEEEQAKLKQLCKRLFEAEVTVMINVGFDFDIELALYWLQEWSRAIGDSHVVKKTEETLTSLYQTSTVLYFEPHLIALTALTIVMKNEGINPAHCSWDISLITRIQEAEESTKSVRDMFLARKRYLYN